MFHAEIDIYSPVEHLGSFKSGRTYDTTVVLFASYSRAWCGLEHQLAHCPSYHQITTPVRVTKSTMSRTVLIDCTIVRRNRWLLALCERTSTGEYQRDAQLRLLVNATPGLAVTH